MILAVGNATRPAAAAPRFYGVAFTPAERPLGCREGGGPAEALTGGGNQLRKAKKKLRRLPEDELLRSWFGALGSLFLDSGAWGPDRPFPKLLCQGGVP